MNFLDRWFGGRKASPAEAGSDGAGKKQGEGGEQAPRPEPSPEEREKARHISELADQARELIERIGQSRVEDVPALSELFARVRGICSTSEDLYSGMRSDLLSTSSGIRQLRRYTKALDRAQAAYRAYELYPKTEYRTTGGEGRADFDTHVSRVEARKSRDHVAGTTSLREVMGL